MPVTPINTAEAIIDPFWDPKLSELDSWSVAGDEAHGLEVRQNWCFVEFGWTSRNPDGPSLSMERAFDIDCGAYDTLVLSAMAPLGSIVRLEADTDRGPRRFEAPPAGVKKREIALPLEGAGRIGRVRIEVESRASGIEAGWLNWLGLASTVHLDRMLAVASNRDTRWEKHLVPENHEPSFAPAYGLVLTAGEIESLRSRHEAMTARGEASPFVAAAERAGTTPPEELIGDFVSFWNDTRYNRERDHGKQILSHGLNAAVAGVLLRDKSLLRLAARYALSIGMCGKWDDGFICFFPGGDFEHRCFVQSLCAYDVAAILDLAGEMFTELGRSFLLRRLAEEAIGSIDFVTWKHEYIFHCNQLAWFTPGRMLALAVLSRHYPRVKPHLETAYRDLCESLDYSILPDGGYVEGPTYFRCVGRDAGLGLYYYARVHGKRLDEVVPESMKRCDVFGEAVMSTDEATDVIPICDARSRHELLSQAMMANLLPGSAWGSMVRKRVALEHGWPADISDRSDDSVPMMGDAAIAWNLVESLPSATSRRANYLELPVMGPIVSIRNLGDHTVKLFIQGNHAGAGHTHEDKGSFVLEFAGETYALDPGSCDYSHPLAEILQHCERHSMLVPVGMSERPHPKSPLPVDLRPVGKGDAKTFSAAIDLAAGWERYYRAWNRRWESPTPDLIEITDSWELSRGDGVEFFWQTRLPVSVEGGRAVVTGRRGRAIIEGPESAAWRVDELPLLDGTQYRLALPLRGVTGKSTVRVQLEAR
jgi:hypothetical protein